MKHSSAVTGKSNSVISSDAIYALIRSSNAILATARGDKRQLPDSLDSFLTLVAEELAAGGVVAFVDSEKSLTTNAAARLLGVSRQFLVGLLQTDALPFHKVGAHHRVYLNDLLSYKRIRDGNRHAILNDLARAEAHESLYDLVPINGRETH